MTTILVVDDEPQIRRAVRHALEGDASIIEAGSVNEANAAAGAARPDVVVLDLGFPDGDGRDVLSALRSWSSAPVLVLSARDTDADKVALLDGGADDYLVKPFSTTELQARVRALLRRSRSEGQEGPMLASSDGLTIDLVRPGAWRNDQEIHLTRTEWELIRTFVKHIGRTLTHQQLFSSVWGPASNDAQQLLRTHIRRLRRKLEIDAVQPLIIVTEPGVGYRLQLEKR